ncbi:MAG: hypothetical protein NC313_01940 [Butyrivibrio sp.]|nr:hypothetical protein [Butyrivibrio sp.]
MRNETIFYRTERNPLIYFITEESITGSKRYVKPRFFHKIQFPSFAVDEEGLRINVIMIPDLQKGWKKDKLLRLMYKSVSEKAAHLEGADIVMQKEVQQLLGQTDLFLPISWPLAQKWIEDRRLDSNRLVKKASSKASSKRRGVFAETVVLLLGNSLFLEEQMQKFMEIMQPCLAQINYLTILYEPDEEDSGTEAEQEQDIRRHNQSEQSIHEQDRWQQDEHGQNKQEEIISEYTEELYYEYGLAAMIQRGSEVRINRNNIAGGQGSVLFLDFGYSGDIPLRALKTGDIYMDIFSSAEKETLLKRKYMEIYYISPRKYLDTLVKSGYDKLVNQTMR